MVIVKLDQNEETKLIICKGKSSTPQMNRQTEHHMRKLTAPVETIQFVSMTHYDVTITSRLAKNIRSTAIFCCNTLN